MKIVALPLASITVVAGAILWFAADAYIRKVVNEEVAGIATGTSNASSLLTQYGGRLDGAERNIERNEDGIERVDDRFTQFVREILAKL